MRNLGKTLLVASVAVASGLLFVPKANAQMIITNPGVVLDSTPAVTTSDVVLTQPAVIDTGIVQPAVIDNTFAAPMVAPAVAPVYTAPHLLNFGLGNLLNFSLF